MRDKLSLSPLERSRQQAKRKLLLFFIISAGILVFSFWRRHSIDSKKTYEQVLQETLLVDRQRLASTSEVKPDNEIDIVQTLRRLGQVKDPAVIEKALVWISHESWLVRVACVKALAPFFEDNLKVQKAFQGSANDPVPQVRHAIIEALSYEKTSIREKTLQEWEKKKALDIHSQVLLRKIKYEWDASNISQNEKTSQFLKNILFREKVEFETLAIALEVLDQVDRKSKKYPEFLKKLSALSWDNRSQERIKNSQELVQAR